MDPLEEFEFRPITEGLGFHQKNAEKKSAEETPAAVLPSLGLKKEIIEPKAPTQSLFSEPILPRTGIAQTPIAKASTPLEVPKFRGPKLSNPQGLRAPLMPKAELKKEIGISAILDKGQIRESQKIIEEIKSEVQECAPSFLSIFLDFTVIAGLSILFLIALSLATQIDVIQIFRGIGSDLGAMAAFVILIYAVSQFYMIISRSFFGQTLGEWSMDSEIGTREQQQRVSYVFRVILRTWVLAISGMIVLPIVSALTQKDVAGSLCGLKLYRR